MTLNPPNSFRLGPDEHGRYGIYGGRFVAETLMPLILELEKAYETAKADPAFREELDSFLEHYVGRPSPLYFAERLTEHLGGAKIYFKRDELNHTGAHKINNVMGQILLARRMGKPASSPRPAPASTASPPPRRAPASGSNASCSWARSTSSGRSPMSSA
jgi:tryptophan synthase beta chain